MDQQGYVSPVDGQEHFVLALILSIATVVGLFIVSIYFYREYLNVVSIFDQSIQSLASTPVVHVKRIIGCPAPTSLSGNTASSTPVILYTQQLSTDDSNDRVFPVMQLQRKKDGAEPEILAEVGKRGEYPAQFVLSSDKTKLAINLEKKLQIFDLKTRQSYDLFFSKKKISTVTFSPDDKEIFIVTEGSSSDLVGDFDFHIFTLTSCIYKTVYHEKENLGTFFEAVWRDDQIVVLNKGYGEGKSSYAFNINTKELLPIGNGTGFEIISKSGKNAVVATNFVTDVCNGLSGAAPSGYRFIEPMSGNIIGTIMDLDNRIEIIAFSPDEKEVLYTIEKPWQHQEDCNKEATKTYVTANFNTGVTTKVTDLNTLISNWKTDYIGAWVKNDQGSSIIYHNNQPIITSTSSLQIIGQYFE